MSGELSIHTCVSEAILVHLAASCLHLRPFGDGCFRFFVHTSMAFEAPSKGVVLATFLGLKGPQTFVSLPQ